MKRILLGALIGASALTAIPAAANASATCTFDAAKRQMDVRYGAADATLSVRNGLGLEFAESTNFRNCFSATGAMATAANTDKVVVRAFSTATGPAVQQTTIDERTSDFSDSNAKLQFFVFTGTGRDRLVVREGTGLDAIKAKQQTGGLAVGPAIDLDADNDTDITMTTGLDSFVTLMGGRDADLLDATAVTSYKVELFGEDGNDSLKGGKLRDSFVGGQGIDTMFANDGVLEDLDGGSEFDTATVDSLDRPKNIEKLK